MNKKLIFKVIGSSGNVYDIVAKRNESELAMSCTCPAGQSGIYCKHRIALLNGDYSMVESCSDDPFVLSDMVRDSDLFQIYNDYLDSERDMAEAKKEVSRRKKQLARMMERDLPSS